MAAKNEGRVARALAAGLGLAAAMAVTTSSADAATNLGDIAASDNRLFIILGLLLAAVSLLADVLGIGIGAGIG